MAKKTSAQRDAERRAEARRRSRAIAQGREVDEDSSDQANDAPQQRPTSMLQRLFPAAPPLPGKGEPMAGFSYSGGLRPLAAAAWLIRRNLLAGVVMGVLWAAAYILTIQYGRSVFGTVASFVSFGSLVAAGWLGWQRPWFYGLVAAILGYLIYSTYVVIAVSGDPTIATFGAKSQLATILAVNGVIQAAIGALAGFYGGYLRRRLSDPTVRQANAARRRR